MTLEILDRLETLMASNGCSKFPVEPHGQSPCLPAGRRGTYFTPRWGDIPAKGRACTPKCLPAVGRRCGTQAWLSTAGVKWGDNKSVLLVDISNNLGLNRTWYYPNGH